jgi:hypothetical protein
MTVRTVSNLPAAMHIETARCLFAIELSKQSWVIGFITPLSAKISRRILSGGDWNGPLDLMEEVRARVRRETGRTVDVISCYEAGYDGFWLHRLLGDRGHGHRFHCHRSEWLQIWSGFCSMDRTCAAGALDGRQAAAWRHLQAGRSLSPTVTRHRCYSRRSTSPAASAKASLDYEAAGQEASQARRRCRSQ